MHSHRSSKYFLSEEKKSPHFFPHLKTSKTDQQSLYLLDPCSSVLSFFHFHFLQLLKHVALGISQVSKTWSWLSSPRDSISVTLSTVKLRPQQRLQVKKYTRFFFFNFFLFFRLLVLMWVFTVLTAYFQQVNCKFCWSILTYADYMYTN